MSAGYQRRSANSIRLTLASVLSDNLDGAWWPHSASIAQELPALIDVLRNPLGQILDIGVNWSSVEGVIDLDSLNRRGIDAIPGWRARHQRVMTVTGSIARTRLLVVPSKTSPALAVMVLRRAAGLPIEARHLESEAFRTAGDIVRAARAECTQCSQTSAEPPASEEHTLVT